MDCSVDCVIVGGGPAGLTAALYLARYRRSVKLIDAGCSRARLIPVARNVPAFPSGISGVELLARLREQLTPYGVAPERAVVTSITSVQDGFEVDYRPLDPRDEASRLSVHARRVVLAAGVQDALPVSANAAELTRNGVLRLCPICDGYEADGKRVAMLGPARSALKHGIFMRTFSRQVSVLAVDLDALLPEERKAAFAAGVELIAVSSFDLAVGPERVPEVKDIAGVLHGFDSIYPVMGCHPETDVLRFPVERSEDGMIIADKHQRTSVPRLYAAGDIVNTLNQISVAAGEAAIAATAVHQSLPHNLL